MDVQALIREAFAARENAYAPYSGFLVGAALLGKSGKVYRGCNVENAAYPVCCCAERTALFTAVCGGETDFAAIAVCGGPKGAPALEACFPCGMCRQALSEFCGPETPVYVAKSPDEWEAFPLGELLPNIFSKRTLG